MSSSAKTHLISKKTLEQVESTYLFDSCVENSNKKSAKSTNMSQFEITQILVAISLLALFAPSLRAQDYDGEAETSITGLNGLTGLTGLSGLSGLSALANDVVTGYAPMSSNSEAGAGSDAIYQSGNGERALTGSEGSDADTGDYEEDSNDSSASEEHPILTKFFNLISGSRHKRSVESPTPAESEHKTHNRVKRGYKGWVPYVSTYVKTDKKANFKWGVSYSKQI